MQYPLFAVLLLPLAGAAFQALTLGAALLPSRNGLSHRFAGLFFLGLGIAIAAEWLIDSAALHACPHLYRVATPLNFLHGPLIYLALHFRWRPGSSLRWTWPHFVPFIASLGMMAPVYALDAESKRALFAEARALPWPVGAPVQMLHIVAYIGAAGLPLWRLYRASRGKGPVRWIVLLWLGLAASTLAGILKVFGSPAWRLAWLPAAVATPVVFAAAYGTLRRCAQRLPPNVADPGSPGAWPPAVAPVVPAAQPATARDRAKYVRSGLRPEIAHTLRRRLDALMADQKPYRDSRLNLRRLAAQLGTKPEWLSQVLNESADRNFFQYLNDQRIAEAKSRLAQAKENPNILALALSVGFNAKSTFYKAFKARVHLTPLEYWRRRRAAESAEEECEPKG